MRGIGSVMAVLDPIRYKAEHTQHPTARTHCGINADALVQPVVVTGFARHCTVKEIGSTHLDIEAKIAQIGSKSLQLHKQDHRPNWGSSGIQIQARQE